MKTTFARMTVAMFAALLAGNSPAFGSTIWTEDFSSGVGRFDQTLGSGATRFSHDPSAGGFIAGTFPRGAVDRRSTDDVATHDSSTPFGFRSVVEPIESGQFQLGYLGFFGSPTANGTENSLTAAFWRTGFTTADDNFRVRIREQNGTDHQGNLVSAPLNTRYYVRADWKPSAGSNGTFSATLATGDYDDLGGTVVGVSSIVPSSNLNFSVNELGLATHEDAAAGNTPRINVYEVAYVVPEPSSALVLMVLASVLFVTHRQAVRV